MSPGDQPTVDQEALTARRMTGCVDQLHPDGTDLHHVAAVVADQMRCAHTGRPLHPGHLLLLEMDRNLDDSSSVLMPSRPHPAISPPT